MDAPDADHTDTDHEDHPRGTLLVAALFLGALIGAWTLMYLMMLSRS